MTAGATQLVVDGLYDYSLPTNRVGCGGGRLCCGSRAGGEKTLAFAINRAPQRAPENQDAYKTLAEQGTSAR